MSFSVNTGVQISKNKDETCIYIKNILDYYAKWNKPGRERQILRGITYMCNLKKKKKVKLIETESGMVVAKCWGMGKIGRSW